MTRRFFVAPAAVAMLMWAHAATGMPTMIRLGYANCAVCHVSPQGGGLLTDYGRSIDEAQSLRGGEYRPSQNRLAQLLSARGAIVQDLRAVFVQQRAWASHTPGTSVFRPRLQYRNLTNLGRSIRVSAVVSAETEFVPRPALRYDPPATPSSLLVNTALVHYKPSESLEFVAGRDQLPTGVNGPDLGTFVRSRNRYGYYDSPMQVKAFWSAGRFQAIPFAYAPAAGNASPPDRESGGGTLAEIDLFGKGTTVVGVSILRGRSTKGTRDLTGGYARLGFGRWGVLVEHDVTSRTRESVELTTEPFTQQASYGQVFWAVREWLVASAIGERLTVERPFLERQTAAKFELSARLTNQASVGVAARAQRNNLADTWARSLTVQVALKSAQ